MQDKQVKQQTLVISRVSCRFSSLHESMASVFLDLTFEAIEIFHKNFQGNCSDLCTLQYADLATTSPQPKEKQLLHDT